MERQLDKPAAALLQASLEDRGLRFLMQAQTEAILGSEGGRAATGACNGCASRTAPRYRRTWW